jgi:heme/copper-type cytochrome/quinol oxidase subunit 3
MPPSVPPESQAHEAASLPSISMRQMGVLVLFVSMTVLFTATIIAFLFTRITSDHYRAPGLPDLPSGLVASTVLIGLTSLTILGAQRAVKQNRLETLERRLWLAAGFSTAFLVMQALNWVAMRPPSDAPSLYLSTFFMLTGVHALHVIGGFVPLGFVVHHAHKRHYSSSHHEGLSLCAQYWHYLGAVWLVLVAMLYFGNR